MISLFVCVGAGEEGGGGTDTHREPAPGKPLAESAGCQRQLQDQEEVRPPERERERERERESLCVSIGGLYYLKWLCVGVCVRVCCPLKSPFESAIYIIMCVSMGGLLNEVAETPLYKYGFPEQCLCVCACVCHVLYKLADLSCTYLYLPANQ